MSVSGIPELKAALRSIVPKLRVRALRNALAAGARVVQRAARAATPVISAASYAVRQGYRRPGTVRRAISVRTSREARRQGNVGVFVNVRPAKGARFATRTSGSLIKVRRRVQVRASERGAKSPTDPFYWRWLNFGKRGFTGVGFLEKGAAQLPQALQVFVRTIGPAIERLNRKQAP